MLITGPRDGTIWGSATALRSTSLQCASIFALTSSSFGHSASSSSWFRDGPATVGALLDATGPVAAADGGPILARGSRFSPSISLWSGRLRASGEPKRHRRQKKLLRQNHHWPRRVSLSSLRRRTPRRGRHDPRDERREVGASSDAHPGPPIPVVGADRARRAHGVERLPAELRVVIVVAPVVRIDARRVDARGVVR